MSATGKCVFVLGMHRSGTSALTGLLSRFGAILGKDLLPANASNPKGFFESRAVVELNNAILQAVGSSWDDMNALPAAWQSLPAMHSLRESISALLLSMNVADGLRVIKDPRLSKTLPLWLEVLAELDVQPKVIMCMREPDVVAQSEKLMKGFPVLKSLLLYMDYSLQGELHSRRVHRIVVAYGDLLADWQEVLRRVDAELGLGLPLDAATLQARGANFISQELNRSQPDSSEFQRCGTLAEMSNALYEALLNCKTNEIDALGQRFAAYQSDIQPWADVLRHVQAIEERFPDLNLERRLSCLRIKSRVSWADTLMTEFDSANSVVKKWSYGAGQQSVRLFFERRCVAEKFRLTFVNRPAYVRVLSLALVRGEVILDRWGYIHESLIGLSKSAFDLTDRTNGFNDAWLFLDGKGYLDVKLPSNQRLDLDPSCCLVLEIEVADTSTAVQPLLAKLGQLRTEASKLRKQLLAQDSTIVNESRVAALANNLADVRSLLQNILAVRDQRFISQQNKLDLMREELLRAEAQLDLLKDLMIGHMGADGRL